ncbi:hypothetical protein FISHEDRAFT_72582 [Fistulina hepatica ATCC 64428]|nr:hypothetical protein FISHEDRAFT_72582 [Fistulina hepatica ATCC 64428]
MHISDLPLDIAQRITNFLQYDTQSLRCLMLVCKAWVTPCRFYIHRYVDVFPPRYASTALSSPPFNRSPCQRLTHVLEISPEIAESMHELRIHEGSHKKHTAWLNYDMTITLLLVRVQPHLRVLRILSVLSSDPKHAHSVVRLVPLPERIVDVLGCRGSIYNGAYASPRTYPRLTELHFRGITFQAISHISEIITAMPALTVLRLEHVKCNTLSPITAPAQLLERPRLLFLTILSRESSYIATVLCNSTCPTVDIDDLQELSICTANDIVTAPLQTGIPSASSSPLNYLLEVSGRNLRHLEIEFCADWTLYQSLDKSQYLDPFAFDLRLTPNVSRIGFALDISFAKEENTIPFAIDVLARACLSAQSRTHMPDLSVGGNPRPDMRDKDATSLEEVNLLVTLYAPPHAFEISQQFADGVYRSWMELDAQLARANHPQLKRVRVDFRLEASEETLPWSEQFMERAVSLLPKLENRGLLFVDYSQVRR